MALRASSYTIYVDLPDDSAHMLLVHGYTGAYDRVSQRVATFIRSLESKKPPRPLYGRWQPEPPINGEVAPPSGEAIALLRQRGYLVDVTEDEEREALAKAVDQLHLLRARQAPMYIFMPTYDCNLRCFYCFQDHMRTDPAHRHLLRRMERPVVDRIFKAMPKIESLHGLAEGSKPRRNVGFFGGEPLLAANRPTIEYIVDRATEEGEADFWAVTNGTELEAYEDLLAPGKIATLQITLDGPPDEHDRRRIYSDGSGSFERIARNITLALGRGVQVQVRINVDRNNLPQLPEIARVVIDREWHQHPAFDIHTAPIHATNGKTDKQLSFSSWELGVAVDELLETFPEMRVFRRADSGMRFRARQIFTQELDPTPGFKTGFCSAHDRMYIFDAFADIYACWERTGDHRIRIGSVTDQGDIESNSPFLNMWRSRTAASNPACLRCRYLLQCGGGCAVLAENSHGRFFGNFCDDFAKRFRASVAEAFQELVSGAAAQEKAPSSVCDQ